MRKCFVFALLVCLAFSLPANAIDEKPEPVKPGLLVIDIQNKYIPMMDQSEKDSALRMINGAIWLFRQYELPVIRVYHTDLDWGPDPESEAFLFPETVNIQDEDPKVVKNFPSAFVKTNLEEILAEEEVNTLFLCGLSATGCVLATYFGAMERQYDVFMIKNALMSPKAEHTEAVQDIVETVGWTSMETLLKAAAR